MGTDDAIAGGGQTEHGGGSVGHVCGQLYSNWYSVKAMFARVKWICVTHTHTVRPAHSSPGLGGPNCRMGMKKMLYIVDFFITNERIRPGFCRGG